MTTYVQVLLRKAKLYELERENLHRRVKVRVRRDG